MNNRQRGITTQIMSIARSSFFLHAIRKRVKTLEKLLLNFEKSTYLDRQSSHVHTHDE